MVSPYDACHGSSSVVECDTADEAMKTAEKIARRFGQEVGVYIRMATAAIPVEFTIDIGE